MKHIPRFLAFGLLLTALVATFSLIYTTRSTAAANPITLTAAPIVYPGDVLTLSGKQRFNNGQMNSLSSTSAPGKSKQGALMQTQCIS
ncbi:MAG TPA: hypothetical protein VJ842_12780 [Pyrinomonadaceae bacterium]|nr:hypothetical protein [Pyrinomonadaceae bacterium]